MPVDDILKDLNTEQKRAVEHKNGPLLIVAGAGTGKTTVITRRLAHLVINEGVRGDEILALTFTNKAAEEMSERSDRLLPYGYVDLWVSTFHTFAQRILEENGMDIGISSSVELLDGTGQWILVHQNLNKFDLDYYRPRNNPTRFIRAMLDHFSRLKDEEIYPEEYLEYAEGLRMSSDSMESSGGRSSNKEKGISNKYADEHNIDESRRIIEIANAYHAYQELLRENNKMDFGDLINYCLKLFRDRPNVLKKYQEQFRYVLVDEFQDTNWAQYDLVKMLALPENNITVVADDDQSIYRFRGASMSNVVQFSKDYKQVAKVSLIRNYRSGQEILDSAHDFIQLNNPNRLEFVHKIGKKLLANTKEKAHVEHLHAKDAQEEARIITETIMSLKEKDKEATWNDFAILTRTNSQTDIFEEMLSAANIPHQNYSAAGLYKTSFVMNILSFFKVLDDYHESRALFRLLSMPFLKISAEDIVKMNHYSNRKRVSLYEIIQAPQKAGVSNKASLSEIERLRAWIMSYSEKAKQEKPSNLLLNWLKEGYMAYLNGLKEAQSQEQFRLLKVFYDHLKLIESSVPDARVRDIVDVVEQEISSGDAGSLPVDLEAGPEMARIMTVHSAKGLEFKYVFVTNLVDRRFPTIERKEAIQIPDELVKEAVPDSLARVMQSGQPERQIGALAERDVHLEEERRLFYVAMTRAKMGLFFTSAENYGGVQKKKLSRFLRELSEAHSEFKPSNEALGASAKSFLSKTAPQYVKKFEVRLPARFSYTQLKTFDECPFAYKMQFLLGVPLPGKFIFSYGTTMHSTLQQFMQLVRQKQGSRQTDLFGNPSVRALKSAESSGQGGLGVTLVELLELYEKNWIDDWYSSKQDMDKAFRTGKQSLKSFYEKLQQGHIPNIKALERNFFSKVGEYTITGKMDRVDSVSDDEVEIVDYKTGNPPKEGRLTLQDKRQLLIYQIAAEGVFRERVKKLTYYYLDSAKPIEFFGTDKEKDDVKQWILDTIEAIYKSDFAPNGKLHICDYCGYFMDIA